MRFADTWKAMNKKTKTAFVILVVPMSLSLLLGFLLAPLVASFGVGVELFDDFETWLTK